MTGSYRHTAACNIPAIFPKYFYDHLEKNETKLGRLSVCWFVGVAPIELAPLVRNERIDFRCNGSIGNRLPTATFKTCPINSNLLKVMSEEGEL